MFPMFEAKDLGIEDRKKVPEDVKSEHRDKVKRESMKSQQADGKHSYCSTANKDL